MMTIDTDMLHAYLDGELEPEAARAVEAAVERDPALRAELEAQRRLRERLSAHFDPALDEAVPERFQALLEPKVVDLAAARERRRPRAWLTPIAMAASLVLGLALGSVAAPARDRDRNGELRQVDEHRPLKADAQVEVSNVAGRIEVQTWDKNELHLTGTLSEEVEKLQITGDASHLRIEVKLPKRTRNVGDTELYLKVPAGISLEAQSVSADIRVDGIKCDLEASSVSGEDSIWPTFSSTIAFTALVSNDYHRGRDDRHR